jgi:hypothetical protein
MADLHAVTDRINQARAACALGPIEGLPKGERGNPCFCPLGRALRKELGDSIFVAVGTRHLRVASTETNAEEVAERIRKAWGVSESRTMMGADQFKLVPLPAEMTQYVVEFDAGKLPEFEGTVELIEKQHFNTLARRLWSVTVDRARRVRHLPQRQ